MISGDTRPSDNLVKFAQGADVLIHEVIAAGAGALKASDRAKQTVSVHMSPEDAGRIFERVKPRLAKYACEPGPRAAGETARRRRAHSSHALDLLGRGGAGRGPDDDRRWGTDRGTALRSRSSLNR